MTGEGAGPGPGADEPVLVPQPAGIPLPDPSERSRPFWDGCAQGRLVLPRCPACGAWAMRAFAVCPACHGTEPGWDEVSGRGVLHSWTVVWRPPHPAFTVPYAPAVVALDEGAWLLSSVVGCRPRELRAGMRLDVTFHAVGAARTLPYVRPGPR